MKEIECFKEMENDYDAVSEGCGNDSGSSSDLLYVIGNHIYFYQEINRTSALVFNKIITDLYFSIIHTMISSGLSNPEIHIHFNSSGGELFSALSMLKALEKVKAGFGVIKVPMRVVTHIDGESSSGSSIISVAGSHRIMGEHSCILIHNALSGMSGKPDDFEDHIANTKMLVDGMKNIYKKYSKVTDKNLEEMLRHNRYLNAQECLELSLIDEIS